MMKEFEKKYKTEPIDFHLWTQRKIAELWWKLALEWVKSCSDEAKNLYMIDVDKLNNELEG